MINFIKRIFARIRMAIYGPTIGDFIKVINEPETHWKAVSSESIREGHEAAVRMIYAYAIQSNIEAEQREKERLN